MRYKLLILTLSLVSCYQKQAEPETYLLKERPVGKVTIFFNEINGQNPEYENGRRIYSISGSKILKTQFGINDGFLDQRYYYIDSNGKRREISIDSTKLYYDRPDLEKAFRFKHLKDTLITIWGISGKVGEKRYQQFVIGTFTNPGSLDTTGNF